MRFFNPTLELKELQILQHIKKFPDTTQKQIANVISGSVSMVNVYVDNLEKEGYIKREYKSSKIVYYNITREGKKRKKFLLINYMKELVDLYVLAKENVEKFLSDIEHKGYNKILIYGAGEVAETILSIIKSRDDNALEVVAVIDDDYDMKGKSILKHKIISKEDIHKHEHEVIVITSYTYEDEIRKKLSEINYPQDKIIRFFN